MGRTLKYVLISLPFLYHSAAFQSISMRTVRSSAISSILNEEGKQLDHFKAELIHLCRLDNPTLDSVRSKVQSLENFAESYGVGQASSSSGLLSGEWELLYSPEDETRSSPFFWAFRRAFPDQSDIFFSLTDSIPAPIKEIGPSFQTIDLNSKTLVSRVKVATLNGLATSIMTTRCTILGEQGLDGLKLQVDSTKPEDSSLLKRFGPLGRFLNDNSEPFPSGQALEILVEDASRVCMLTTFCDEALRVSRNQDKFGDVYVWKRKSFGKGMDI